MRRTLTLEEARDAFVHAAQHESEALVDELRQLIVDLLDVYEQTETENVLVEMLSALDDSKR